MIAEMEAGLEVDGAERRGQPVLKRRKFQRKICRLFRVPLHGAERKSRHLQQYRKSWGCVYQLFTGAVSDPH